MSDLFGEKSFAEWLDPIVCEMADEGFPQPQIVQVLLKQLPRQYEDQLLSPGLGQRIAAILRRHNYVPDYAAKQDDGVPRVRPEQLSLPGIVAFVSVRLRQGEKDTQAWLRTVENWCAEHADLGYTVEDIIEMARTEGSA